MESFRQAVKGWLGMTMLALLAVPLVLVGMESYFSGGRTVMAADVNGVEISQTQLDRAYQGQLQQVQARLGNARLSDDERVELRRQVLDNLVQRQLLLQSGERAGYRVSDQQVLRLIRETPAFQDNGRFSPQRYASVLSQIGESPASFPERARQEVITAQRMSGWLQSAFVTRQEAARLLALDGQTRDVSYVEFPVAAYLDRVSIDDDDVRTAYEREARLFQQPEQVRVDYLLLSANAFADQVSVVEEAIQARYQQRLQALSANEERRAAHILIAGAGSESRAKVEALLKRLQDGESFAELARAHSEDPGSASDGGDLDFASRGQFEPDFEQALFALQSPGDISPVVQTPFGFHLIQLQEVRRPPQPSLASLRDELAREVRLAEAEELYLEAIERVDAAAYESSSLQEVAEVAGVSVQRSAWFSRQGGQGLTADARVIDTAFSDELIREKRNSTAVSLPDGSTVWLHVAEHQPARKRPLAEVRDLIQAKLASERAMQLAKTDAEALLAAARVSGDLAAAQRPVRQQRGLSRRDQTLEPALLMALFRAEQPREGQAVASLATLPDRVLVSLVTAVQPGPVEGDDLREIVAGALAENRGQQELQTLLAFLRDKAKVKVFDQRPSQD